MVRLLALFVMFFSFRALAEERRDFQGCGKYKIYGTLHLKNLEPQLHVLEGSYSEFVFTLDLGDPKNVMPYLEKYLEVEAEVPDVTLTHRATLKPMRISTLYYTEDQLKHRGFSLIEKLPCAKK